MIILRLYFLILAALWVTPSYAYLDPGTGSMILQSLLALLGVAAGMWYVFTEKVKYYFSKIFKSKKKDNA